MITTIAQFNVENLFDRAAVMNLDDPKKGKPLLEAFAAVNERLLKPVYTAADKKVIVNALKVLGLEKSDESEWAFLRQNHGRLVKRSKGQMSVVANGPDDWVGSVDLKDGPVEQTATLMTAKVIADAGADIVIAEEIEGLKALRDFNNRQLKKFDAAYDHMISIRGRDTRDIDVALMTRGDRTIESIVSHVDDVGADGKPIFSRDALELLVHTGGQPILVIVNHLKSQGYGDPKKNDAKRKAQAQRVREIYEARRAAGFDRIIVGGDLNCVATSDSLLPLLGNGSDLKDVSTHPKFADTNLGTYADGKKLDYILLSPALYATVVGGGIHRKGMWKDRQHYSEITRECDAASDHALIYAALDL